MPKSWYPLLLGCADPMAPLWLRVEPPWHMLLKTGEQSIHETLHTPKRTFTKPWLGGCAGVPDDA